MGCSSSNEWYKQELIKVIDKSEQEIKYMIEQIIISSSFNERDIYFLYQKFLRLDPCDGLISNNQLMELPEFKYCPFKNHLIRVFKLNKDDDMPKNSDQVDLQLQQNIDLDLVGSIKEVDNYQNKILIHNHQSINDVENDNLQNIKKIINQEVKFHQPIVAKNRVRSNSYIKIPINVGKQYIDFKKFCQIMKVFNIKTEVEVKIKFYFDLYDFDGDGKISKKDLKSFLSIINTKDELDIDYINQDQDQDQVSDISIENIMEPMIDIIFREIVYNTKSGYIDFREFKTLMWHTNIDKTCVMYLEE